MIALLPRAVDYLLATLHDLDIDRTAPTPCRGWDLHMLLAHIDESLAALCEGMTGGAVDTAASAPTSDDLVLTSIRIRCTGLLAGWACLSAAPITVGDRTTPAALLGTLGALELTVHAWDVAASGPRPAPIPEQLADELLLAAPHLVPVTGRQPLFAPPVCPASDAPGDQLLAYLGRSAPTRRCGCTRCTESLRCQSIRIADPESHQPR